MGTLILIGFVGGLITGVSPCILPVLPVIFFSAADTATRQRTPYFVITGLVCSFSTVTLAGSALLTLLRLPQDALRWVALVALVAIGLGLIFPRLDALLERPFSRLPQRNLTGGRSGFGLGLALGVLYVPCAGPVLAAIVLAGATGQIGTETVALTLAFTVGAALPLLCFALAGRRITERVAAFRRRQRGIRVVAGVVTIALAVGLVFNLPALVQRAVPDYTSALQQEVGDDAHIREQLNLGGLITEQNAQLSNCSNGAPELETCGPAPDIRGITAWLNTPEGAAVDLKSLRGKVVLVDFWAYSCINCQRAIPHLVDWYERYHDAGFEVIGVHTPEYAFERVESNVRSGTDQLGITYPVAMDNGYSTWTDYRNRYWPAKYLIDADGTVRHIKFGEGDYAVTEELIRELLAAADPTVELPSPVDASDTTPQAVTTPETYFSVGKMVNFGGTQIYDEGTATFTYPEDLAADSFALRGPWALDYQGVTAVGDDSAIKLNYSAAQVYLVVGGTGTVSVTRDGITTEIPIGGPPTLHQIVADSQPRSATLEVRLSQGLQAFSFTYG
ncbi:MAG: cytochrome c biogenesis protein DipZ [Mycobacterium sp.]